MEKVLTLSCRLMRLTLKDHIRQRLNLQLPRATVSIETVAALSLQVDRIQTNVSMQADANDTRILGLAADKKLLVLAVAMSRHIQVCAETLLIVLIADMARRTRNRVMAANRPESMAAPLPQRETIRLARRENAHLQQRLENALHLSSVHRRLNVVAPVADLEVNVPRRSDSAVTPTLR